jgi:hypothetical protein
VCDERIECVRHVAIAHIPRRCPAFEHRAIVPFCVRHKSRVLLGVKKGIFRHKTIATKIILRVPPQVHELCQDFFLTTLIQTVARGKPIALTIFTEVIEAGIAAAARSAAGRSACSR